MKKIIPIKDLRNTVEIDRLVKENNEPIFITKNGYSDLVIMSHDYYINIFEKLENKRKYSSSVSIKENDEHFGFVRVKTKRIGVNPGVVDTNKKQIIDEIQNPANRNIDILLFQELTLSGATLDDVLLFDPLLKKCESAIKEIVNLSKKYEFMIIFGSPLRVENKIYNVAISVHKGLILNITPKIDVVKPYSVLTDDKEIVLCGQKVNFGTSTILVSNYYHSLKIAFEIGSDFLSSESKIKEYALSGATLILNLSAIPELLENKDLIKNTIGVISKKYHLAYVLNNAGYGESTSDVAFGGEQYASEDGDLIESVTPFEEKDSITVDIDIDKISKVRLLKNFKEKYENMSYIGFDLKVAKKDDLCRQNHKNPFLKNTDVIDTILVKYILDIQANGLIKRLKAVGLKKVILGLSGGLDSTLALIVAVEAFRKLNYDLQNILCITMPAFGTTSKTKNNSHILAKSLGVHIREINISASVTQHLLDIGHDLSVKDIAYENAQARERTQVLMDIANKEGALQLGTGDLSELCLGWCTYNGDQMSMYSINSSIPKTMVKYLCAGYGLLYPEAKSVIDDIVDTPVSPELIPSGKDVISQKTEDIIGPYFLHDFFIYHFLSYSFSPKKLYFLATNTFLDELSKEEILKWLKVFYRRFFQNHFKRSAAPDGVKISEISISKKDLCMPSDCSGSLFISELDNLDF